MGELPASGVGWQELSKSECFGLLARERVGRVALVDDLGPIVMPVNFVLDRHMVVFRTDGGTKLDVAVRGSRVAFEIDGIDEAARTGWSVVVRGEAVEDRTRTVAAARLVAEVVPAARQGLVEAGVAAEEADRLLDVICARAATGQTGAVWQRATLAAAEQRHDRERALAVMLELYLRYSRTGLPVHTWPVVSNPRFTGTD